MTAAFVHGFLLALALILPMGPQNTFVVTEGATASTWRSVWPVVVTAAIADTGLIAAAVGGASLVVLAVPALSLILSMAGIVFILYMGWRAWGDSGRARAGAAPGSRAPTLHEKVRYSLSVSLFNPHAVMDTVVVIGGGATLYATAGEKWAYAGAAALVSWLWFMALSLAGRGLQQMVRTERAQGLLNRVSALLMWGVALRMGISLWQQGPGL